MRQQKRPQGEWLKGPTGIWGVGQGRKSSDRRDRQWRSEVVDPYPGGHSAQDHKRGDNQVHRVVQLILRVTDGEGVRTRRVTGKIQKTVERWYRDK